MSWHDNYEVPARVCSCGHPLVDHPEYPSGLRACDWCGCTLGRTEVPGER
jgi:hypothetical protein